MARRRTGSIRQRGNGYQIKFSPSNGGKLLYESVGSYEDARKRWLELELQDQQGLLSTSDSTLAQLLKEYMDSTVIDLAIQTRENYQYRIDSHINPAIGHLRLDKLTAQPIRRLLAKMVEEGYSDSNVKGVQSLLRVALAQAQKDGLIARSPIDGMKAVRGKQTKEVVIPEPEEVADFLNAAKTLYPRLYNSMELIVRTGMRRGECLGLTWDRVNIGKARITINKSLNPTKTEGVVVGPTKGRNTRIIPLDSASLRVLVQQQRRQDEIRSEMGEAYDYQGFVFANVEGRRIHPVQFSTAVKSCWKRVGRPDLGVHSLRHFYASMSLQKGVSVIQVSKLLGHANPSITANVYAHVLDVWQEQAVEVIGSAFDEILKGGRKVADRPEMAEIS